MKISYDESRKRFIARCTFDERHELTRAGFSFDPFLRKYVTSKIENALKLRPSLTSSAKNYIKKNSCETIPWLKGLEVSPGEKLKPVQTEGALFCLSRNHSYLAFEQRLGKTPTSLTVANTLLKRYPVSGRLLIVVPPLKLLDWFDDLKRWCPNLSLGDTLLIGSTSIIPTLESMNDAVKSSFGCVLISDTLIADPTLNKFLKSQEFTLLINDESHRFCNEGTTRTDALLGSKKGGYSDGLVSICERTLFLSGTPMPNRPLEMWAILRSMAWNVIDHMSYEDFCIKFCGGRYVEVRKGKMALEAKGASNLNELQGKLSHFMITEKLSDHTRFVPRSKIVTLRGSKATTLSDFDKDLLKKGSLEDYFEGQIELGEIAKYRSEISKQKLIPGTEYLLTTLMLGGADTRYLVFAVHTNLLHEAAGVISNAGYSVAVIDGKVSKGLRQEIKKDFQAGKIDVLFGQVETMFGIDLFRADHAIFLESPWSPRAINQASLRLARLDKDRPMLCEHLVIKDSIEEYVLRRALEKMENIDKVVKK